jgi:hypothetical protein
VRVGGAGVEIPDLTAGGGDCDGDGSMGDECWWRGLVLPCCAIDGARNVFTAPSNYARDGDGPRTGWAVMRESYQSMLFFLAKPLMLHNRHFS